MIFARMSNRCYKTFGVSLQVGLFLQVFMLGIKAGGWLLCADENKNQAQRKRRKCETMSTISREDGIGRLYEIMET